MGKRGEEGAQGREKRLGKWNQKQKFFSRTKGEKTLLKKNKNGK